MSLQGDLALAATAPRQEVEALWRQKLPKVPIPSLPLPTFRRALAFELQMKKAADLSPATHAMLTEALPKTKDQSAQTTSTGCKPPRRQSPAPLPVGSTLVREWNGRRYQVRVMDSGFEMDGRTYKSLSQIAKTITGTHWSGPRFFGLVKTPGKQDFIDQPNDGSHS